VSAAPGTVFAISAQTLHDADPGEPFEVIHLGGLAAAIVPLSELRRLQAVERLAAPEAVEEAEIETTLATHREWVAAGRPGEVSQEEAARQLLGRGA
jgi:antitoxin (DNA-binding transcriptional repressor) of toxin-antitoxin stability system